MARETKLLQIALKDKVRLDHGLSTVFVTKDKHPGFKKWQEYGKLDQSDVEIRKLYGKRGIDYIGYSYYTGFNGLIDIDFDWSWTYHVACRHFKERMETRTLKTPNQGYRVLFITDKPKDYLNFKDKPPRVEIHGNKGHHIIVYGRFKDQNGHSKKYEVVKDTNIIKDNQIIKDMSEFLRDINEKCKFLEYKCIASCLKDKINYLTQEQRTSIGSFFAAEKIDMKTAIDFFRTCEDFDEELTLDHMSRLYEKGFKHPTCTKLKDNFHWDEKNCKNCIRKKKHTTPDEAIKDNDYYDPDLSHVNESDIFSFKEVDGDFKYVKCVSETPIFEFDNKMYYVIPLKSVGIHTLENNIPVLTQKKTIGVYGLKTGYGYNPLDLCTNENDATAMARISDVNRLNNLNQSRIIEQCIKEAINTSQDVKKGTEFIHTNLSLGGVVDVPCLIKDKFNYYIKLEDPIQYYIAACFVIGTYMFPLFNTFGYLIISGEKGAGKGTFLDLFQLTCWNSTKKVITPTEATLFRTVKEQLPTMIIDEYHRTITNSGVGTAMVAIIESGYEKGGTVPRAETVHDGKDKRYKIVDYPVYCPKILATRKPVEADDKAIKFIIPKMPKDETYAKRKKELMNDSFFKTVRKDLLNYVLLNQEDILLAYNHIEPNSKLNGREFNVWLPVIAIASVAFPEKYEEVMKFAEDTIAKNRSSFYEKETRVLMALYMLYQENLLGDGGKKLNESSYLVTNKEIKDKIHEIEGEWIHHNTIKSGLENMKLSSFSQPGAYYIKKSNLKKLFTDRGFDEYTAIENISEQLKSMIENEAPGKLKSSEVI